MKTKSLKHLIVYTLVMNIPMAAGICVAAQYLTVRSFNLRLFLINFALGFLISCLVGILIPSVQWGSALAEKLHCPAGSRLQGLVINGVVNLVFVVFNSLVLSWFNICVLNHAPLHAIAAGLCQLFLPLLLIGFAISYLWNPAAERITAKICGD